MELKVWCDGIQRVVCGVSSGTTCQEVVFALAHATAQTGRFILIEKWRNSERLLAPTEHPLTVLSNWGEYANDVTFVMKRSEQNTNKTQYNLNNSINSSLLSPTHLSTVGIGGTGSPNRKVLFNNNNSNNNNKKSGFQQNSGCSSPSNSKPNPNQTSTPSLTQTPNPSSLKSNTNPNSSHNSNNISNNNEINKRVIDSTTNTTDLTQTKQQMNNKNNNNNTYESTTPTPTKTCSAANLRPRHPPPYSEAINSSSLITGQSTGSPTPNCTPNSGSSHSNQCPDSGSIVYTNKRRSVEPSPQTQSKQRTSSQQKELLLHRDAVRLVDMQKETMRTQEKEMLSLEQQITSIESKLLENELLINRYKEEMECAHQLWLDQEVMIDQLDHQMFGDELDELVDKAQCYEEEVTTLKRKLSSCEADIGDCRQSITKLMDQLEESDRLAKLSELDREETERQLAEQLRNKIRDQNKEFEAQKTDLQTLTNNIAQLDTVLAEKNTEVDRLLADLKEANIQGLALQTGDESHKFCTNSRQPFQQRSGSTRRIIGSPRELENAVATNKNPHGVWV